MKFQQIQQFLCVVIAFAFCLHHFSAQEYGTHICSKGKFSWSRERILEELQPFLTAYRELPVSNDGGVGIMHAFAQWCMIKFLKPKYIIESGVHKGWGSFMLRKAAGPHTHFVYISPEAPSGPGQFFIDTGPSTKLWNRHFHDFKDISWNDSPINTPEARQSTLIYFDDHQSGFKRVKQAANAGFVHIMFDDCYPAYGDAYSVKEVCDGDGSIDRMFHDNHDLTEFIYNDNFHGKRTTIDVKAKQCLKQEMMDLVDIYYEFPPLWSEGRYKVWEDHHRIREMKAIYPVPLLSLNNASALFQNDMRFIGSQSLRYSFVTYLKLKPNLANTITSTQCLSPQIAKDFDI